VLSVGNSSRQCWLTCHSSNQMLVVTHHIGADACVSSYQWWVCVTHHISADDCHSSWKPSRALCVTK